MCKPISPCVSKVETKLKINKKSPFFYKIHKFFNPPEKKKFLVVLTDFTDTYEHKT